nr:cyclase [Mycobacterium florentinum]
MVNQALLCDPAGVLDRAWVITEGTRLSNAGRWGDDDELGTWNLVTPEKIRAAMAIVRRGEVFSLALPFGAGGPDGPPGRPPPQHFLTLTGSDLLASETMRTPGFADDWIVMNLSCSTQWDGFTHVFSDGTTYNNVGCETVTARAGASRNSVSVLAQHVVSRGVLLDIPRLFDRAWLEPGEAITGEHLDACCASTGLLVGPGDVVLIRTGALAQVRERGDWGDYAGKGPQPGMSATTAAWFADRDVAAVATDTWGFEVLPYETSDTVAPLHQILLSRCGITIGEMFDLEQLAGDCARDRRFEFLFVAQPLPITGAVNAPINPLAIK